MPAGELNVRKMANLGPGSASSGPPTKSNLGAIYSATRPAREHVLSIYVAFWRARPKPYCTIYENWRVWRKLDFLNKDPSRAWQRPCSDTNAQKGLRQEGALLTEPLLRALLSAPSSRTRFERRQSLRAHLGASARRSLATCVRAAIPDSSSTASPTPETPKIATHRRRRPAGGLSARAHSSMIPMKSCAAGCGRAIPRRRATSRR